MRFISKTAIQYNDWNGVGYIILDPVKGSGAYMISGGLAGADPSRPLPTSQRELNALYARLCSQTRWIIIQTAGSLIGTKYLMGGKDPTTGYIDCSGLVAYCYNQAGIRSLNGKNAAQQYDVSHPADYPLYADLVFFKNTYKVGISHVGIALPYQLMIHASSSVGVTLAPVSVFSALKYAGYRYVDMPSCK
jgi:peptidoglycan endopeptidase LytE